MTLQLLIDKQDSFEVIRDQIAGILVSERDNQKALAVLEDKDPALWDFDVYLERTQPWEDLMPPAPGRKLALVNVWYDSSTFNESGSNISERQQTLGTFNLDCYASAVAEQTEEGHNPSDEAAAREVQRVLRLVRNILMAAENTYLGLQGLVGQRWPVSANMFQPQIDARPVTEVIAARLALRVKFNEFSPQYVPENLEYVAIDIRRLEDGLVILEADYDYT